MNFAMVYDARTRRLAKGYKLAVVAALPTGVKPTLAFWSALRGIVRAYVASETNRASRRAPAAEIKRWQRS